MGFGSLNIPHDQNVRTYVEHYKRGLRVLFAFKRFMSQSANVLGDVLKAVLRAVLPIFTSGASTFLKGAAHNISEGISFGNKVKESLPGS